MKLSGGTSSELYLLHCDETKYVIKSNTSQILKVEADFLECYKNLNMIPNLIFVEQSIDYIIYSYISGSTNCAVVNKRSMLKTLVEEVINNYKAVPKDFAGFGYTDELTTSWKDFLFNELSEANHILKPHLAKQEYLFVLDVLGRIKYQDTVRNPFLLHGDCGVHNFIFNNEKQLVGVIDPTPIIGYPLYDVIYAFCSTPEGLSKETIDLAISHMSSKGEKKATFLYAEVIIGLYLRLATCVKHHPNDYDKYLTAWNYWKNIINHQFEKSSHPS